MQANLVLDWWPVFAGLVSAAAVYGGIRADLRGMAERIRNNEKQIERLFDMHIKGGE